MTVGRSDLTQLVFLHVGKAAGTSLRAVIGEHNRRDPSSQIVVLPHAFTLERVAREQPNAEFGFFVRQPVDRFVSGFNSRLRKGRPRFDNPWSPQESVAFARFPTANALGEALASGDEEIRCEAERAMNAIEHARLDLRHYLGSVELVESLKSRIKFIGHQPDFDEDIARLKRMLRMDPSIQPPADDVGTHRTPAGMDRSLSEAARRALANWYAVDEEIYQWCLARRRQLVERAQQ